MTLAVGIGQGDQSHFYHLDNASGLVSPMPKIKFMLVDDQQLVRAGIRRILPQVKVIALTAMDGEPFRLHDAGAAGYLTKGCPASGMRISPKTVSTYRQRIFSTSWRSRTRWN